MCSGLENHNRLTNLKISRSKLRENLENKKRFIFLFIMRFPESAVDSTAFSNQIRVPVLVRGTFAARRNVRKACKISNTQMHVKALQLIFKFV